MAINESVYGARENWIVPSSRTELGHSYSGDVYYYNQIASDDNLKIKVANFDTLSRPVTSFCSQMDGQYPNESYLIRNNWTPTQTDPIDRSIVQFGIGSQSGLADIEWWGVEWATGQSEPTGSENPSLLNHDKYDIVNIGLGLENAYIPPMNYTTSQASNLTTGDMLITGMQYTNRQLWGDQRCAFSTDSSSFYSYHVASGYAFLNFITQIPIKNLKIYPRITAYKSDTQWKQFNSIQDYLAEKNDYPLLGCIEAMFQYRSGLSNTTDYNATVSITPIFTDKTTVCKGYHNGSGDNEIIRDENLWYCRNWRQHFVVAGRYGYDSTMSNKIYWVNTYDSRPYTYAIFDAVYQTPDFKFTIDSNKNFTCDVSAMTDNDITKGIRKQLASFGLFFVDSIADINEPLDSDKTFLGVLTDGVAYGDYTNGADNRNQPQWGWDTMEQNTYDPSNPPAQDRSSDPVTFNPVSLADGGLKRYVLDDNAMSAFGVDLYRVIDTSNPDELIQNQTLTNFLTNNPLDAVVSVKRFPLLDMSQGALTNIMLGKVQMQTAAKPFASTATILSCGSINIPAKFGNFLDFETQYELILPFCGTISLDPKIVTGKNVEVKYSIDYTTGTCTAWILTVTSDGIETVIDSANGNCTIDIPLSGVQTATLMGEIYNANENLKTAKFNAVVNGVSGIGEFAKDVKNRDVAGGTRTVANAVNSIHDIKKSEWNINNTQIPFKMIGASSGCNAFQIELTPRLNVYYPIVDSTYNAADYRHNVGSAVCDTTTIGDYSGYAEITNVDLSGFVATAEEKNMIANALMGGVYL
mgnify:CR=1 FL=1